MAKLSDELDSIHRQSAGIRDAVSASNDTITAALERIDTDVQKLRDGDLSDEQKTAVDGITAQTGEIRSAVDSTGDGYTAPVVEQAPVKGVKGRPAPGSVADRERGSI